MAWEVIASEGLIYAAERMSTLRPHLTRSAGLGLTAGLSLGAIFLAIRAVLLSAPSCEGMLAQDCALAHEIARNLTRLHALASVGLALIAGGVYWWLRSKRR